jgi:hypothetical protein
MKRDAGSVIVAGIASVNWGSNNEGEVPTLPQIEAIIEEPEDGDEACSEISLNVFELLQNELLATNAVPANANYRTVVALSSTARFAKQTRRILALIVKCNNEAKLQGKEEIFKPTTRLLESYSNLPWIAVHDEESLGNFVDRLYFMLYEAAGKDNLRFLAEGYLRDGDCTLSGQSNTYAINIYGMIQITGNLVI